MEAGAESGWPVPAAETWAAFYGIAWLCGFHRMAARGGFC